MAAKDRKAKLLVEFDEKIAEINKICSKATTSELEGKLTELKNIESEYHGIREKEVFASLADIHEALVTHRFETISHKKTTKDGVMTGVEKDKRFVQIDLKRFCEHRGFDLGWYYEMQALNKRLTLKAAEELGVSAKEMKRIDSSYSMDKLASEIELGKTPTSNTQCVKHMQKVLDELSSGEGRVNNHDLAYVWMCYAKRNNKKALRIVCSRHTVLQSLLMDVFHRVAINGGYGVDCKQNEPETTDDKVSEKTVGATEKPVKKASKTADKVSEKSVDSSEKAA